MDNERILLGSSLPLLEVEEDDDGDMEQDASLEYDMLNILDSISTDEFKAHYTMAMNKIKNECIENQRIFATKILDKIEEFYDYVPPIKHLLDELYQINLVYDFIEFLEFDHVIFLSNLWKDFDIDLRKIDIEQFCINNTNKFMLLIDDQTKIDNLSLMITEYLRTNISLKMIEFIIKKTSESKMLVQMEILILKGEK
jgi:hypothetical protein